MPAVVNAIDQLALKFTFEASEVLYNMLQLRTIKLGH